MGSTNFKSDNSMTSLVGIDAIGFYTSPYYIDLQAFAEARNVPSEHYYQSLGQYKMAVPSPNMDIVTMAAEAAERTLRYTNKEDIELVLFATESSIDQSKAAGIYVQRLLNLSNYCRVIELKQACYSATAGLQFALALLKTGQIKKALLIAADVARYPLNSSGEPTQGCGAVALVLSLEPKLMVFDTHSGFYSRDVMDFWRPNYLSEALVNGKYSIQVYLDALEKSWKHYEARSGFPYPFHHQFCFHAPFPRLVEKAQTYLAKINNCPTNKTDLLQQIQSSLAYNRLVGNTYAASLYISLLSLLETCEQDLTRQRVGFYSYGSGCVAEFFSGYVAPNYKAYLDMAYHQNLLSSRTALTVSDYEAFHQFRLPTNGEKLVVPKYPTGSYHLTEHANHQRIYQCIR